MTHPHFLPSRHTLLGQQDQTTTQTRLTSLSLKILLKKSAQQLRKCSQQIENIIVLIISRFAQIEDTRSVTNLYRTAAVHNPSA
eukprot:scaffold38589_cov40-Attheya_sp.AAC.3